MTPRDEVVAPGDGEDAERHAGDSGAAPPRRHHHGQRRRSGRGLGQDDSDTQRSGDSGPDSSPEDDGGEGSGSEGPSADESASSEAGSRSTEYLEPRGHGRGRHHHHHRGSHPVPGASRGRAASNRQSLPASRRGGGRRLHVVVDQPGSSGDEADGNAERGSSESGESGIIQDGEDPSDVRARQEALNTRHPFGLPIWKPALYKKSRSVTRAAFLALHARPLRSGKLFLKPGNIAWLLLAGWWLMLVCIAIAALLLIVPRGGRHYARVAGGLGWYLLWPFGRYVERIKHGAAAAEDRRGHANADGDGQEDEDEDAPLLGGPADSAARFRRETALGRAVFYVLLVTVLNPILIFVSALSWFAVFSIPMGKLAHTLARYLWRDPLSLHFRSGDLPTVKVPLAAAGSSAGAAAAAAPTEAGDAPQTTAEEPAPTVLLCTNEAVGWYYYKYTVDGVNILFYNMLSVAVFVLVAAFAIGPLTDHRHPLVQPGVLFPLCLVSTVPLAYFIGQGVSSISAQSSLGMGAVINATFGSIVEVILYSIALTQGKAQLVQGALIGSLLAGLMLMPGTSMIAGGVKHKVQRFNAKSAEVTATLVIMSIIGAFAPTIFYHTFAVPEFECQDEAVAVAGAGQGGSGGGTVRRCRQTNVNFLDDPFYHETVKPFMYFCTAILPLAYLIALWFSLKTHVRQIYSSAPTSNPIIRHILELFRRAVGPEASGRIAQRMHQARAGPAQPHYQHHHSGDPAPFAGGHPQSAAREHAETLVASPTAATAAAAAAASAAQPDGAPLRSPMRPPRSPSYINTATRGHTHHCNAGSGTTAGYNPADAPSSMPNVPRLSELPRVLAADPDDQLPDLALLEHVAGDGMSAGEGGGHGGGHGAPNWGKTKSALILCACTVAFALIAEVLVDTVDVVIQDVGIKEKYIGLTLFALVPNVTEFLNAIAFAIQGNIALSIEISNAYTVQVALLQIPILVFFSAFYGVPDLVAAPSAAGVSKAWASAASVFTGWASSDSHLPTEPSAYVFALLFPRWDLISILFCVFLLTYMLIEGKANYFKGSILCLSYAVWLVGYAFEPSRPA